jgi:dTDP-4-dehydrorhamnose 3,5-epimerase-like enzyme
MEAGLEDFAGRGRMNGVNWVELPLFADARGCLVALDPQAPAPHSRRPPFKLQRVYYIFGCGPHAVRAEHAQSADQLFTSLNGSVTLMADNGSETDHYQLDAPVRALHIRAGVWVRLQDFSRGAVVLVASPVSYQDVIYFAAPQPHRLVPQAEEAAA